MIKMKKKIKIAEVITYISQAPIVAIFGFLYLVIVTRLSQPWVVSLITSFFAGVLPYGTSFLLSGEEFEQYLQLAREKRKNLFIAGIISYSIGFLLLYVLPSPAIITGLMFCYITNTIMIASVNQLWKISVHASGISGPITAIILYLAHPLSLLLFLLIIPVCWSRVILGAHTKMQVIAGSLLTILLTWVQLTWLLPIL